jgi:hypothetical protein
MHSAFLPRTGNEPQPTENGNSPSARRIPHSEISLPRPRVMPLPRSDWPLWARAIAKFRRPGDLGLGDTLVHLIGDARSNRFKKWFTRKFGKSCGCTERQRWLNRRFPYAADPLQ